ncbi:hypothetical protein [Actinocrispum wychmicini]|uniref:Uncharacterized protein n=1 Tax=Actinocrispum wychmicini TaxID=1213861 RepID=A0A4R2JPA9_9PSEU|nr:hypothetical protein [Actinocrispum wychmicini]TCO61983.1 hypothetical protein EV192_102120 [Actinocrispum wychmicini]
MSRRKAIDDPHQTATPRPEPKRIGIEISGHNLESHKQWMTAFWHASRVCGKVAPPISTEALRYVPPEDLDFLDEFYEWYRRFPFVRHLNPKHIKDQTYLTVVAFPEIRDFSTLATLNHCMLLIFYVDDHRLQINLEGLIDDSEADPVVHEFTEQIKSELPEAYGEFMDLFREYCSANLLQGKVKNSWLLYSRVKSKTMGIILVHYTLWSIRKLPPEKFGALKLHNYVYHLELDTVMVNDRHSLEKESGSREWNEIAAHGLTDEEHAAMIDDNYVHLITTLGELLATEDDPSCVAAYENFKICADATKTWEGFSPRYRVAQSDTKAEGQESSNPSNIGIPCGPTGLGTASLRVIDQLRNSRFRQQ